MSVPDDQFPEAISGCHDISAGGVPLEEIGEIIHVYSVIYIEGESHFHIRLSIPVLMFVHT